MGLVTPCVQGVVHQTFQSRAAANNTCAVCRGCVVGGLDLLSNGARASTWENVATPCTTRAAHWVFGRLSSCPPFLASRSQFVPLYFFVVRTQ